MTAFGYVALALSTLALAGCGAHAEAVGPIPSAWTSFRLVPELNAVVGSSSDAPLHWTYAAHGGISSSPTVVGDTVYLASNDGRVQALDLRSGRPRWIYRADDVVMTAPLVDRGMVIVGEGNNHADPSMFDPPHFLMLGDGANALIGLDAATGRERWKHRVPGSAMPTGAIVGDAYVEHDAAGMIFSYGIVDGEYRWRTYVGSTAAMTAANRFRDATVATAGDYPNAVIAIDGRSGTVLWRTPFPESAGGFDDCPLASDGNVLYGLYNARPADSRFPFVGYTTPAVQHAYALDGSSGRRLWDVPLLRGVLPINNSTAIPLLYRGTLFFGSAMAPDVFALDARTGAVRWHRHVNGPVKGGMAARDGVVYFGDGGGTFWALDATTGAVDHSRTLPDRFGVGSPVIVGSTVIDGGIGGTLFAMPLATFAFAQRQP